MNRIQKRLCVIALVAFVTCVAINFHIIDMWFSDRSVAVATTINVHALLVELAAIVILFAIGFVWSNHPNRPHSDSKLGDYPLFHSLAFPSPRA